MIQGSGSLNSSELLDANGLNLAAFTGVSGPIIVAGALPGLDCGSVTLLVQLNSVYKVVSIGKKSGAWTTLYTFPSNAPAGASAYTFVYNSGIYTGQAISLTGMAYHASGGQDLFMWGNALFYSPDGGTTMLLVTLFPSSSVTLMHFTSSSSDGAFAFITSDFTEYYGQLGASGVVRLTTTSRIPAPGSTFKPFFDDAGALWELTLSGSGTAFTTSATRLDTTSAVQFWNLVGGQVCPYAGIVFDAPWDASLVRMYVSF
ncbi:hypothetical protein BC830DRAFT_412153 [Chytriomyces sp. MP71]|nr:hypothetical protein BC830DRAFT_412153 [Chytriomyces sp. MP71]